MVQCNYYVFKNYSDCMVLRDYEFLKKYINQLIIMKMKNNFFLCFNVIFLVRYYKNIFLKYEINS